MMVVLEFHLTSSIMSHQPVTVLVTQHGVCLLDMSIVKRMARRLMLKSAVIHKKE